MKPAAASGGLSQPISAGIVTALVGVTSSFVVVLAGLTAVGASPRQAASGLLAVSVAMGIASMVLARWSRIPVTIAWSTPGAAVLVSAGIVDGGWPAAVGAFLLVGVLIALTGLVPLLGRLIAMIPTSIAQAMLAGVLLQICLGVVTGLSANPLAVAPVVLVWLVALRLVPRWAVPLAFATAAVVIGISVVRAGTDVPLATLVPRVELTSPAFTFAAIIGIAIPLYLVTMASQNVPGVAVMKSLGYDVPWRRTMLVTGAGTVAGAPAGGHAINLAAITAALAAGPEAGEERSRRWVASFSSGVTACVLGVASSAFVALVLLAPEGVIPAVAGLALLGTLAASIKAAVDVPGDQIPAVVTFVMAASGVALLGVSAAFWALVAGIAVRFVLRWRTSPRTEPTPADDAR